MTLGFPGEGPFRWTEFLEAKVEKRLEEEEEGADEEKEKEKRKVDESEAFEPTSSTSVQLELEHPFSASTTFPSHIMMDHVCLWRQRAAWGSAEVRVQQPGLQSSKG